MTAAVSPTVVGVFKDRGQAEEAVQDLRSAGFSADQVGLLARHAETPQDVPPAPQETRAAEGGVTGAITGGALGTALGAVAVGLIPGLGPVIAAGLLAGLVGGAAAGALTGGLVGTLIGLGIHEDEARYYHRELEAGRVLVTVRAGTRHDDAVRILRLHGALGQGSPLI